MRVAYQTSYPSSSPISARVHSVSVRRASRLPEGLSRYWPMTSRIQRDGRKGVRDALDDGKGAPSGLSNHERR